MASNKTVSPATETVTHEATSPVAPADSVGYVPKFKVVKSVTRPVLKFGASPEYITIEGPMYKGEVLEKSKIKNVPTLLDVVNLKTGENMIMVCATVFIKEMEEAYPKDSYVGKSFQVRKIKSGPAATDYSIWAITEIEVE